MAADMMCEVLWYDAQLDFYESVNINSKYNKTKNRKKDEL